MPPFQPCMCSQALLHTHTLTPCQPLAPPRPQLLLLFWGTFETSRPSDWLLRQLGTAAGLDVDAIDYQVPLALQAAAVALFGATGVGVAAAFQVFLGDATWSVSTGEQAGAAALCLRGRRAGMPACSTRCRVGQERHFSAVLHAATPHASPSGPPGPGLGALLGAAMYEAGRPRRLNVEEAKAKEALWQDFRRFADAQLQRRGRCHETEILRALGRAQPRYRGDRMLDGLTLR